MLWIGSKVAVVPIGAPQLSQKDANDALGVRHEWQMISPGLASDFTLQVNRLWYLVLACKANLRIAPGAREYLLIRSVYSV